MTDKDFPPLDALYDAPAERIQLAGMPSDTAAARNLLKRDPLAYGAWATALLATQLDDAAHGPSVAVGTRPWGHKAVGLVPLGNGAELFAKWEGTAYSVGFVVDGPSSAELARRLGEAGTADVRRVPLGALVGAAVEATGHATVDLELAL